MSSPQVSYRSSGVTLSRPVLTEDDPRWKPTFDSIPLISFKDMEGTREQRLALAAQLRDICLNVGFFYATDTGVPQDVVTQTFAAMKEFFALDDEIKIKSHWSNTPGARGYEPFFETKALANAQTDIRESFALGDCYFDEEQNYKGEIPKHAIRQNAWPDKDCPQFRKAIYNYYSHVEPFARKLLRIFALAMGLDDDTAFDKDHTNCILGMRAIHYPPQDDSETAPSLSAHTDFSSFTLVCQEPGTAPGLEVLNLNGHWISAPPLPEATFTCNVGDFIEMLTNGQFVSTVHRVRNITGSHRYSLPFFFSPNPETIIRPLDSFLNVKKNAESDFEQKAQSKEIQVGKHYVKGVLNSRVLHPSSIYVREQGIPTEQWTYDMLQGSLPIKYKVTEAN